MRYFGDPNKFPHNLYITKSGQLKCRNKMKLQNYLKNSKLVGTFGECDVVIVERNELIKLIEQANKMYQTHNEQWSF